MIGVVEFYNDLRRRMKRGIRVIMYRLGNWRRRQDGLERLLIEK